MEINLYKVSGTDSPSENKPVFASPEEIATRFSLCTNHQLHGTNACGAHEAPLNVRNL